MKRERKVSTMRMNGWRLRRNGIVASPGFDEFLVSTLLHRRCIFMLSLSCMYTIMIMDSVVSQYLCSFMATAFPDCKSHMDNLDISNDAR